MAEEKKLFGMPAEKGRWLLIVLGFIINICLGSVYAYSIFGKQLVKEWGIDTSVSSGIFQQQIPFGVFLLFFAAVFPLSGQLLEKLGPKKQGIIGGIIVAAGWILASFVASGTESVPLFVLTYGVIGGIGVGLCYIAPIQVATRWFPDKKGLATGLTVAGFGGSPFISTYLGQELIKMNNHVSDALLYLGIAFLVILIAAFWLMRFPEAGWKPAGWTPKATTAAATSAVNYNRNEIIKTPAFWVLFACFTIGSLAGLMAIGIYANVMSNTRIALAVSTAALSTATIVQFILAPFNAGGRPVLGAVTDKLGPRVAAMITFVLILLAAGGMIVIGKGTDTATDPEQGALLRLLCRLLRRPGRLAGDRPDSSRAVLRHQVLLPQLRCPLPGLRRRWPDRHLRSRLLKGHIQRAPSLDMLHPGGHPGGARLRAGGVLHEATQAGGGTQEVERCST